MNNENTPLINVQTHNNLDLEDAHDATEQRVSHVDIMFFCVALPDIRQNSVWAGLHCSKPNLKTLTGIFLASVDDPFVLSTHGEIASNFHHVSIRPWLTAAYNLKYATRLPLVDT
jgi:hypothetical protein